MLVPKVSIIMPCYNQALYVSEAIEGVLNQTFGDIELIIIDDCSTDNSADIIRNYEKLDNRIMAIYHDTNKGVSLSRNDGLAASMGEYIAFCDSDDVWEKNKLYVQLSSFEKNGGAGLIHSDSLIIDENGRPTGQRFSSIYHKGETLSGNLFERLCLTNFINTSTVIIHRRCVDDAGWFGEGIDHGEDWVYWVKIARRNTLLYIDDVLSRYRIHRQSTNVRISRGGVTTNRIKGYQVILKTYLDIPTKLRSKILYLMGVDYLFLGDTKSANDYFRRSLNANMFNIKSVTRYLITQLKNL